MARTTGALREGDQIIVVGNRELEDGKEIEIVGWDDEQPLASEEQSEEQSEDEAQASEAAPDDATDAASSEQTPADDDEDV